MQRRRNDRPEKPVESADAATLSRLLARYGFQLEARQLDLLTAFHAHLIERNRRLNLTRIWNLDEIVLKHYVDCFMVTQFVQPLPSPLLDLGTGGGFPGIPLKILSPDTQIILGEGVQKRVEFLKEVRQKLGLAKLDIIGRNIDREFEYPVNGVITRAVEPIRDTLKAVRNCLVSGGLAIFMKGPNVEQEVGEAARKYPQHFELAFDHQYVLPASPHQRRLVIFRKTATWRPDES
jgi:16S rRNA (guanine527-N7)-methyltransferase